MAKIIEHGKYWSKALGKVATPESTVLIKCPECNNTFLVYKQACFDLGLEAQCLCGCKFIPEEFDIVKETK